MLDVRRRQIRSLGPGNREIAYRVNIRYFLAILQSWMLPGDENGNCRHELFRS